MALFFIELEPMTQDEKAFFKALGARIATLRRLLGSRSAWRPRLEPATTCAHARRERGGLDR
jgi:hypothetical protein